MEKDNKALEKELVIQWSEFPRIYIPSTMARKLVRTELMAGKAWDPIGVRREANGKRRSLGMEAIQMVTSVFSQRSVWSSCSTNQSA